MEKRDRIKELVEKLNEASKKYYQEDTEIMSNLEYDALYDELVELEKETGIVMSNSPTVHVGYEIVSELPKEAHEHPMLSLDKTKSVEALAAWLGTHQGVISWKLDGLTVVLTYENGTLVKAVTRGNGLEGEVITNNARVFANIPKEIPYKGKLTIRGEAVIKYSDFEKINEQIADADAKYKNPRNLCSGSVRQLNNRITKERNVHFFAFNLVDGEDVDFKNSFSYELDWLEQQGFDVVEHYLIDADKLPERVAQFAEQIEKNDFPSDGLVLVLEDLAYGKSLGRTAKFPRDSMAFKWADEQAVTHLQYVEWSPSRTGLINPVAVFDPVSLEGTTVSRASIHNVSILRSLQLGIGDEISVYKANMIIPQIAENLTRNGDKLFTVPDKCPICGGHVKITGENETEELQCMNLECKGKLLGELCTFVSKEAHDITGLSKSTLSLLIEKEFIKGPLDLFYLKDCRGMLVTLQGLGAKKVDKILESIEKCRKTTLPKFLYGLSIPLIGRSVSKQLNTVEEKRAREKGLKTAFDSFIKDMDSQYDFTCLEDFGFAKASSLKNYFEENQRYITELAAEFQFEEVSQENVKDGLNGAIFCITGTLTEFANRAALVEKIESLGGKVTGSVTKKTNYLINNDTLSKSSKNVKAMQLGIPIISEKEFINKFVKKC